jgi:hypothetical protein
MTEKHENKQHSSKTKAEPEEERPTERRKLTDFFVASGGGAKSPSSPATVSEAEPSSAPNAAPSPAPPPPTTEEVALDISRASEAVAKRARAETKAEREARWAREGAALAASLAATRLRPKSPKKRDAEKTPRAEARASFPTEPHTSRVPGKERVSRGRAEARAAPVASAPRLALAPPATSPDPPTRLAAPRLAPMEKPRAVGVGPDFDPPRVSAPADRRRGDRDDAARRERRARRAQAREAREKASREDGSGRSLSVFEDVGFARDANPAPEKKNARVAEPRLAPRRAASRETDDAVDRMMARSVRVGVGALRNDDGTPSKHRRRLVLRDEASNGAKNVAAAAAGSSLAAKIKSSLAAAAASAAGALSELAEQAYDGGGEFAADANKENKIRMESVVTVSVDGSDVLVHTREVAVEGKQI